jgi:WD40 repeat protein
VRDGNTLTLDQGIPAHQIAEEVNGAVEPPPKKGAKKKKAAPKTNGVAPPPVEHQVNGDAMDIDHHNGHTNVTNSVRAESEIMASDVESPVVVDIPISTLSIGQSTEIQTEVPVDLASHTTFSCSVRDSDKKVTQTVWGTPGNPLLLAAGKSLLRLHFIPESTGVNSTSTPQTLDLRLPLDNYAVTALCWNARGEVTVSAREEHRNEVGEVLKVDKLVKVIDGGFDYRVVSTTAGLVTTLRWNDAAQLLLAISSDGRKGSIKIWKDREDDQSIQLPSWTDFTDTNIYDAVWTSDSSFVICGEGLFAIYDVGDALTCRQKVETKINWDVVKYDATSGIIAALGMEHQTSFLGILDPTDPTNLQIKEYPDEYFTDLAFRPAPPTHANGVSSYSTTASSPVWLATCATNGVARIWDASQPFRCLKRLPLTDYSMANSIAFSPDGNLLAAAGPDAVTLWNLGKREEPVAVWRAQDFGNGDWDPTVDGEFSLGWDPDGSRLSIALGNQVCIALYSTSVSDVSRLPSLQYSILLVS